MATRSRRPSPRTQQGFTLIVLLALVTMGVLYTFVNGLTPLEMKLKQAQGTQAVLQQAKDALIAYAITYRDRNADEVFGYLPCPDSDGDGDLLGSDALADDTHCGQFLNGASGQDQVAVGLLPYKSLGLGELRDNADTCLWYAVSPRHKATNTSPKATPLNWDTRGQIRIMDTDGTSVLADPLTGAEGGAVAVIFAAGAPIATQARTISGSNPCGITSKEAWSAFLEAATFDRNGNFSSSETAPLIVTRGTSGDTKNNDLIAWITARELFDRIVSRKDFSNGLTASPAGQINTLIDRIRAALEKLIQDDIFSFGAPNGSIPYNSASYTPKPTGIQVGEVNPTLDIGLTNQSSYANYLSNWYDQFRVAVCDSYGSPCLTINNGSANCRGTLVFAGRNSDGSLRQSSQRTSILDNFRYFFEAALSLLRGQSTSFSGQSTYSPTTPSADVAVCLGTGTYVSLAQSASAFASGTIVPNGGGNAVASVSTGATPSINLGSSTNNARSGCVWYPTALPIDSSLRLYFTFKINSAGSTARGYTLTLADAGTNDPTSTNPIMCGASGSTRLGYAGAPISGEATTTSGTAFISGRSWSSTSGRATISTVTSHGFYVGQTVTVTNVSPAGYNGTFTIVTVPSSTQFTYTVANPGPNIAGIAPPKLAVEFDTYTDSSRNDPSGDHFAFIYWGTAADNNPQATSTTRDGSDDNTHNVGMLGSASQPLNPRSLSLSSATITSIANIIAASWDSSTSTATLTTATPHGFTSGQSITLSDLTPLGYKGTYTVTVTDSTHFTIPIATSPGNFPLSSSANISAASWSGSKVTVTTSTAHGLTTGQGVTISNASPAAFNGTYTATVIDSTHFSYFASTSPGTYGSGGIATLASASMTAFPAAATTATMSAASWSAGTVTVTTTAAHGLTTGQMVEISNASPSTLNGPYVVTVTDATHFQYALASDPGGSFDGSTFATPGIATVKLTDAFLPYSSLPTGTDIHVRLDIIRSYDTTRHQATLSLKAYIGDTFALAGNCSLADFKNFSRDLSALCPVRTPTIEQSGVIINDVAGPALSKAYLGFTTARGSSDSDDQSITIQNLILRSQ